MHSSLMGRRSKRSASLTCYFQDVQKPMIGRLQSFQMPRPRRSRRTIT